MVMRHLLKGEVSSACRGVADELQSQLKLLMPDVCYHLAFQHIWVSWGQCQNCRKKHDEVVHSDQH